MQDALAHLLKESWNERNDICVRFADVLCDRCCIEPRTVPIDDRRKVQCHRREEAYIPHQFREGVGEGEEQHQTRSLGHQSRLERLTHIREVVSVGLNDPLRRASGSGGVDQRRDVLGSKRRGPLRWRDFRIG